MATSSTVNPRPLDPHGAVIRCGGFHNDGLKLWHDQVHNAIMNFASEANVPASQEPGIFSNLLHQSDHADTRKGLRPDILMEVCEDFQDVDKKDINDMGSVVECLGELKIIHSAPPPPPSNLASRTQSRYCPRSYQGKNLPAVNHRASQIWKEYEKKAKDADLRHFPEQHANDTGPILSKMNRYHKMSLVLGEFGEYSHDLYQLIKFLARKKAQYLSFINPAYLTDTEAYSACLWDFRRRLSLISAKNYCRTIHNGHCLFGGSNKQPSSPPSAIYSIIRNRALQSSEQDLFSPGVMTGARLIDAEEEELTH